MVCITHARCIRAFVLCSAFTRTCFAARSSQQRLARSSDSSHVKWACVSWRALISAAWYLKLRGPLPGVSSCEPDTAGVTPHTQHCSMLPSTIMLLSSVLSASTAKAGLAQSLRVCAQPAQLWRSSVPLRYTLLRFGAFMQRVFTYPLLSQACAACVRFPIAQNTCVRCRRSLTTS